MTTGSLPAGPAGGQVACSGCGAALDSLRAGHVAIFRAQVHFFCNYRRCRARYLGHPVTAPPPLAAPTPAAAGPPHDDGPDIDLQPVRLAEVALAKPEIPAPLRIDESQEVIEPLEDPVVAVLPQAAEAPAERRDVGLLLEALSFVAGVLAMALEWAPPHGLVQVARVVLLAVSIAALTGRAYTAERDAARPHWLVWLVAPLLALGVATVAVMLKPVQEAGRAVFLAAVVVTVAAANGWLVGHAWRPISAARRWVRRRLAVGVRLLQEDGSRAAALAPNEEVEVGQQVVVEAGETIAVDMLIDSGDGEVLPWLGAVTTVRRRAGEPLVAGGRLVSGQLRGRCTRSGDGRALARTLFVDDSRPDAHVKLAKWPRQLVERWSPLLALAAGGLALVGGWGALDVVMVALGAFAALANPAVGGMSALVVARGVHAALGRGVVYRDAAAWEQCAQVTAAVFCARGTLLRGEPELVEVEATAARKGLGLRDEQVLALAAGALATQRHPAALAVRRAAETKGVTPEPVRDTRAAAGRGVLGVAATGDALTVGTRALMLERRISIAAAEQRVYQLEGMGRTVLLVAKAGRLVGLLALQDGLRAGARAAVQLLLDAGVEPVLMSVDTPETCEALGRALDIEHVRSEVVPDEQPEAIERIRAMAGTVAVLGHTPHDDQALGAADAAVVLLAAGSSRTEFAASLVNDDVRDAALALALAHGTRKQALVAMALVLLPTLFGVTVVIAGWLPPEYAPIAQLIGVVAALWHLRVGDGRRSG